jgi:hypothetical protein
MSLLRGVWIGDADRDEFRPVRAWLDRSASDLSLTVVPTVTAFSAIGTPADLVIISESWPDEFTAEDVTRLVTIAPLARMICLAGAWSEAVGRTRSHWPPAWRVPLWDAISRLERELASLRLCRSGTHSPAAAFPPWTASRQETWLWQQSSLISPAPSGVEHSISLDELADPALAAWLREQLTSAGHRIVSIDPTVVIFDVDPWSSSIGEKLRSAVAKHVGAIAIALTAWSMPELRSDLAAIGIHHIADKLAPESLLRVLCGISLRSPTKLNT